MENWFTNYFDNDYLWLLTLKDDIQRTIRQVEFVIKTVSLKENQKVLDIGCGYGRHVIQFSKMGYQIVGLDLNSDYIKEGLRKLRELNLEAILVQGDMRDLPFQDQEFNLATFFFTSFGYFSEEDNYKVLKETCRILKPGGYIFLDLENRDHLIKYFKEEVIREYPEFIMLEKHYYDVFSGVQTTRRIFIREGKIKEVFRKLRLYTLSEMKWLLSEAGFSQFIIFGDYLGSDYTLETTRMLIFAKKVEN